MPSIVNGLFSGRSGIASHGTAIAVVGDNISNASTTGYKSSRAEFRDILAGGQTAGKVVGSGSSIAAVSTNFEQGTLEFTGKPLDLAVDGNGFFVVADGANSDQRFYTRAGDFKVDSAGYVVTQEGKAVLGFPGSGGTGDLQPMNINTVSQSSVATQNVALAGNLNASATIVPSASIPTTATAGAALGVSPPTTTYSDLNELAEFSTVVKTFDSLGAGHTLTFFFFHTATNQYTVKAYASSEEVDPSGTATGLPRLIASGTKVIDFGGDGSRSNPPATGTSDFTSAIPWNNSADPSSIDITFSPFTQYAAASSILSISQDGQGIGTVTSVNIQKDGTVFALLSNGQSATIGRLGLANFSNAEGLTRVGGNLFQQSGESGEPIVGRPQTGTFGSVDAGSIELSTVDIATEFVRLITLQRGFQASSRIITTINQLLNEVIQLA